MDQAELFQPEEPERCTPPRPRASLFVPRKPTDWQERFDAFHAKKPQVYAMLVALAKGVRQRWPKRKVGIELLMNRVRWDFSFDTSNSGEEFKINQNFAAYYARLIMKREPDLADMFELRKLKRDRCAV